MEHHLTNVKRLITRFEVEVKGASSLEAKKAAYSWVQAMRELAEFLQKQTDLATPIPKELGDISDLPDALVKELSVKSVDELERQLQTVMRACGGKANLDQLLVGLFRKYKVVQTRRFLQNKLYRMLRKNLAFQVPGERATYCLTRPVTETRTAGQGKELDDEIPF
ncbi:MAG TPA: hypothetical protein VN802_06185 [Stellaceae bacterium]|nr:hypothetical protein [Stellaceae bacterium]